MTDRLTNSILLHIFDNLGITSTNRVSLLSKSFQLSDTIRLENEDGNFEDIYLYGAQISIDKSKFKILCGNFSNQAKELVLICKLDNCPTYACYLSIEHEPYEGMIAFALKEKAWLVSNTYIQATFLAGMENLKEVGAVWNQIEKYYDLVDEIKSFIEYYDGYTNAFRTDE